MHSLSKDDLKDNDIVEMKLKEHAMTYGLTYEFRHYVALCGLFPPKRNIVKNWKHNQIIFVNLVKGEGKIGL